MATSFSEKRKRLKYLFSILAIIVFIGILIILVPKLSPTIEPMISPEIETPIKKINIDFGVFSSPVLVMSQPFPSIIFPGPQAKKVSLSPTLEWQKVSGAETYRWEIFGVASGVTEETSVKIDKKLEPSITYAWRVKACIDGEDVCSIWSGDCQAEKSFGCWRFTTVEGMRVILTSPASRAENVSITPALAWQSVSGAEIYFWEIVGQESGQTEQTSVTVRNRLKPSTIYVWRVKACTRDESMCSAWASQVFTTTFVILPPDLILPLETVEKETEEGESEQEKIDEKEKTKEIGRENPFIFYKKI